jgi:peptidoglycan pentaglycine glycine transferase (the first glycine)
MPILNRSEWDTFLAKYPDAHLLQTSAWGELKSDFGWEPVRFSRGDCGAQVLFRKLPFGFSVAYIPKGPVGKGWKKFWPELEEVCKRKKAIFIKVEPDLWEPNSEIQANMPGFQAEKKPIQPRRTLIVDLDGDEKDWLARMSKKTRACFRSAERGGVVAGRSNDVEAFFRILNETGQRETFAVHSLPYYQKVFSVFAKQDEVNLIMADWAGQPLAGLMVFAHGKRAWYLYAASRDEQRQLNPTYLAQLEAMRWAAHRGCKQYDLYGVPDFDEETLEDEFVERREGLWGVYGFKRKFGGKLMRSVGAWEKVFIPALYRFYQIWVERRGGE